MPRRLLAILAFATAFLLTLGAWHQVILYKSPPHDQIALWLPFIILLRSHDGFPVVIWLVQFPIFAGIFILATRRWPPLRLIVIMFGFYALCSWCAFLMLKANLWSGDAVLQTSVSGEHSATLYA